MRSLFFLLLLIPAMVFAGEVSTGWIGSKAIQGYDSVKYYGDAGAPTKGDKSFVYKWRGADWYFADEASLDAFSAAPENYAPQYGGHCANAMSLNKKVDSNAKIWLIHDGQLYLFAGKSGLKRWKNPENNIAELIQQANINWAELKEK